MRPPRPPLDPPLILTIQGDCKIRVITPFEFCTSLEDCHLVGVEKLVHLSDLKSYAGGSARSWQVQPSRIGRRVEVRRRTIQV